MPLSPETQELKVATGKLVRAAGGQESAVNFCRVIRHQTLSDYGNVECASFMPIDVACDIEAHTKGLPGHPHVTRVMARRAGFGLFALPTAKPESVSWPQHLACIAKETGEMVAGLAAAVADGKVDQAEARDLLNAADEAIDSAIALRAALAAVAEDTS